MKSILSIMRAVQAASIIGLIFALVLGFLAFGEISTLQTTIQGLASPLGGFAFTITPIVLILVGGVIGIGSVFAVLLLILRRL